MPCIFISYRRNDTFDITSRIYERLSAVFNQPYWLVFQPENVIRDVASGAFQAGEDFRTRIQKRVENCDVLLVVIGKNWLPARLHEPNDMVRFEIETALKDTTIRVIPVLVKDAPMPAAHELPASIQALAFIQAISIVDRTDSFFNESLRGLIQEIKTTRSEKKTHVKILWKRFATLVIFSIFFALSLLGIYLILRQPSDATDTQIPSLTASVTASLTATETETLLPAPSATVAELPTSLPSIPTAIITCPNGFCDIFESTNGTCRADCGVSATPAPPTPTPFIPISTPTQPCGDGFCLSNEACPVDCDGAGGGGAVTSTPFCGDGYCHPNEGTQQSCVVDCGTPRP